MGGERAVEIRDREGGGRRTTLICIKRYLVTLNMCNEAELSINRGRRPGIHKSCLGIYAAG